MNKLVIIIFCPEGEWLHKKKILNRFCICFSLVTHFPSIWVTNKSRICLCNIRRKHLSCPSQVYTNLFFPNMFDSGCSLTKPLSGRNTCRHTKIFLKLLQPVSYLLSLFTVFLLHDSVFVLTCFNPLGVHFFWKNAGFWNQDFVSLWLDRG